MTSAWFEGDDQLLEELAVARSEQLPDAAQTEMMMVGFDIVMAETLEAELVHDSDVDLMAAVRSDTAGSRMLSYEADGLEIEFELAGGLVVGHIEPPQDGAVHLDQPMADGPPPEAVSPNDLGAFEFPLRFPATFRLRFVTADGRSISTGWIDGPHETQS